MMKDPSTQMAFIAVAIGVAAFALLLLYTMWRNFQLNHLRRLRKLHPPEAR